MKLKDNTKIAVVGAIGCGKSTLTKNLSELLGVPYMPEFKEDDVIFHTMLDWLYEGREVELYLQSYFITQHFKAQGEMGDKTHIIDTFLTSHQIFAHMNLKAQESDDAYTKQRKTIEFNAYNMMYYYFMGVVRKPSFMIILDISDEGALERILERGRKEELDNFEKNKEYFLKLNKVFTQSSITKCEDEGIPYAVINVDGLEQYETLTRAVAELYWSGMFETKNLDKPLQKIEFKINKLRVGRDAGL